jgi:hypothetical protein
MIGVSHHFHLRLMLRLDNLRLGGALRWKAEDCQMEWSGSEMWKVGTSKVVAPTCVG